MVRFLSGMTGTGKPQQPVLSGRRTGPATRGLPERGAFYEDAAYYPAGENPFAYVPVRVPAYYGTNAAIGGHA